MTLSSTGSLVFDGSSSLTNGGVLTDDNTAADSIELGAGGFTVTGGTICGTAPSLNSTPLTFSGTLVGRRRIAPRAPRTRSRPARGRTP